MKGVGGQYYFRQRGSGAAGLKQQIPTVVVVHLNPPQRTDYGKQYHHPANQKGYSGPFLRGGLAGLETYTGG